MNYKYGQDPLVSSVEKENLCCFVGSDGQYIGLPDKHYKTIFTSALCLMSFTTKSILRFYLRKSTPITIYLFHKPTKMSKPKATIKILPVYLPTEDEVARLGANSDTNNNNNNKKKKKNRTTFEKLAEVEAAAFYEADPELSEMLFGPPSEAGRTHRAEELMTQLRENKTLKIFKAVVVPSSSSLSSSLRDTTEESSGDGQKSEEEEEEEIVAFTVWQFHDEPQPVEEWFDKDWPMSPCPQACNDFFGAFSKARNRFMGGKKHARMSLRSLLLLHLCSILVPRASG